MSLIIKHTKTRRFNFLFIFKILNKEEPVDVLERPIRNYCVVNYYIFIREENDEKNIKVPENNDFVIKIGLGQNFIKLRAA